MRVLIALGGNALLRRGEAMTPENQRRNIRRAANSIAEVMREGHQVIITHGNGPQVGLLALQAAAYNTESSFPLDILGANTEGMIGYVLQQELDNLFGDEMEFATLLTQIEVDANDAAFQEPTKPIGPFYSEEDAQSISAARGWVMKQVGDNWRRVVPSPAPKRILELGVIRKLIDLDVTVICAGGGGIPVVQHSDGVFLGIEAVIDKDYASGMLAAKLECDAFLMLTDVDAVYAGWGTDDARALHRVAPKDLAAMSFPAGSMGPKVSAAVTFAEETGGFAGIGTLVDAKNMVEGNAGTIVSND